MTTLVVPSTSAPCGLVSYLQSIARLELSPGPDFLVVARSELARGLAPARTVATGPSRREMTDTLRAVADRYETVESHGPRALLAARHARLNSRKLQHVFHESPLNDPLRGLPEVALAMGLRRYANGVALADHLRRLGVGVGGVLPPVLWPDVQTLTREAARDALGVDGDILLGVIGRLNPSKAPGLALEAVLVLPPHLLTRTTLVFVGAGPLALQLRARAREVGLRAAFVGTVPGAAALVKAFDTVVVPSPRESFGLSFAEALLAGVPVAAVRSPGTLLLTHTGRSPFQLANPDPASLGQAIERGLTSDIDQRALRAAILATYGPQSSAGRLANHYADGSAAAERLRV
jgi:glycosyltransferase involved in cell wall biosynthesis